MDLALYKSNTYYYRILYVYGDNVILSCPFFQVPPITDYSMDGHTYRYYHGDPLYPFGYGLSYSKFRYLDLAVKSAQITPGQNVSVTVRVMNEGPHDADEVSAENINHFFGLFPICGRCIKFSISTFSGPVFLLSLLHPSSCIFL